MAGSSRIQPTATQRVYWRKAASGGSTPPVDGPAPGGGGFSFDAWLRCDKIRYRGGAQPGHAILSVIPLDGLAVTINEAFRWYDPDDMVRVEVTPPDDPLTGGARQVIFEGVMSRRGVDIERDATRDDERASITAIASCTLDDQLSSHLIMGRWASDASGDPAFIDSPYLPVNFGEPTRDADATIGSAAFGLAAPLFARGGEGASWSLGQALVYLVTHHLVGRSGDALGRYTGIEADTLSLLASGSLNSIAAPPLDVTGMGVLTAIEQLCNAAGFRMACLPAATAGDVDRSWALRIWERGRGVEQPLHLQPRESSSGSAEQTLRRNDFNKLRMVVDTQRSRGESTLVAPVLIEAAFELKPLWLPFDMAEGELDSSLQEPGDADNPSTYHQRHVSGGAQFADYAHVGRLWGLDLTGDADGYDDGAYAHPEDGVDLVALLGLNDSPLATEYGGDITWLRRERAMLPLQSEQYKAAGIGVMLEVSEDGGENWQRVPIRVRPSRERFALQLVGGEAHNLATINLEALRTGETPDVEESWWALIQADNQSLRLRAYCSIVADHAVAGRAPLRASAGSQYPRGEFARLSRRPVIWRSPAPDSGNPWMLVSEDSQATLTALAESRRYAGEAAMLRGTIDSWLMQVTRWRVGDVVPAIRGRDLNLDATRGGSPRHPSIDAITVTLAPDEEQGITIDLEDELMSQGAN